MWAHADTYMISIPVLHDMYALVYMIHTCMQYVHACAYTHVYTRGRTLRAIAKRKEAALMSERCRVQEPARHIDDRLAVEPLRSNLRWLVAFFEIPVCEKEGTRACARMQDNAYIHEMRTCSHTEACAANE